MEILKTLVEDGLLRPAPASALWHVDGSKFDEQVLRSRGAALLGVREISRGWLGYNLPLQLTSFIGRAKEIADIKGLLDSARLVTLTGSGGTGKTRLSQEVGAQLLTWPALVPRSSPCDRRSRPESHFAGCGHACAARVLQSPWSSLGRYGKRVGVQRIAQDVLCKKGTAGG